jgi:hypothetical protein
MRSLLLTCLCVVGGLFFTTEASAQYGGFAAQSHCAPAVQSAGCYGGYCPPVQSQAFFAPTYVYPQVQTFAYPQTFGYAYPTVFRSFAAPHCGQIQTFRSFRTFGGY